MRKQETKKVNNSKDQKKSGYNLVVSEHYDGQRLDNYLLREFKSVPKSLLYRLLRKGAIRVNSKRAKTDARVVTDDKIYVPSLRLGESGDIGRKSENLKVPNDFIEMIKANILYEDKYLLVLNKPAGVASHGGTGIIFGVAEVVKEIYKNDFIELIHRLDRGTSGCLVLAKKSSVLKKLNQMLADGDINKTYHAVVSGRWPKACHRVELPLLKKEFGSKGVRQVFVDHKNGKSALSTVSIISSFGEKATLLALHPKTGRTHQLRVHTAHMGSPILGDDKYGNKNNIVNKQNKGIKISRMYLHAYKIKFKHPITGDDILVTAPYDKKLTDFISQL